MQLNENKRATIERKYLIYRIFSWIVIHSDHRLFRIGLTGVNSWVYKK